MKETLQAKASFLLPKPCWEGLSFQKKPNKNLLCCSVTLACLVGPALAPRGVTALRPRPVLLFPAISNSCDEPERSWVLEHPGSSDATPAPNLKPVPG